jgi:hypothetical protein
MTHSGRSGTAFLVEVVLFKVKTHHPSLQLGIRKAGAFAAAPHDFTLLRSLSVLQRNLNGVISPSSFSHDS